MLGNSPDSTHRDVRRATTAAGSVMTAPGTARSTSRPRLVTALKISGTTVRPARSAARANSEPPMHAQHRHAQWSCRHDRVGHDLVHQRGVVQRAMGAHVAHGAAGSAGGGLQVAELLFELRDQGVEGNFKAAPTESLPIEVRHLGSDRDQAFGGLIADARHALGVADVTAAGDVGAGHAFQDRRVDGCTVGPGELSHIAAQIGHTWVEAFMPSP